MVRHVVILTWVDGADEQAVADVERGLAALPAAIDAIRGYRFDRDLGLSEGNGHLVVVADFDDEAGYLAYRDHPEHRAVIADRIAPILASRAAVQVALTP